MEGENMSERSKRAGKRNQSERRSELIKALWGSEEVPTLAQARKRWILYSTALFTFDWCSNGQLIKRITTIDNVLSLVV